MPTRNINLTEHYDRFVEEQLNSGRFSNASEVLRAGLNLLEKQNREEEEKLRVLKALVAEGLEALERGEYTVLNGEEELTEFIAQLGKQAGQMVANANRMEVDNAASPIY